MVENSRKTDDSGKYKDDEQILGDYIDLLLAGEPVDFEKILEDHPQSGAEIIEQLKVFQEAGETIKTGSEQPLGTLGDYSLRRQLGRGGMGVVYEAWQSSLDRQVALKVLPAGIAADNKSFTRFMREAKTAAHLNHPNIVHVHSVGLEENTPYYAMELVRGETLSRLLRTIVESDPETPTVFGHKDSAAYFDGLARAFADVADGLQHAHSKGVIHRDIKPSNLILDATATASPSGTVTLRILDFGLALQEGQESLTMSGDFLGTPLYMSPEQARRHKVTIDHRTDIYSLGATMYESFIGRPPFKGKDHQETLSRIIERDPVEPRKLNPRVPVDLETIVLKCLRKNAADRYGTAEALGQDLRRFARGDPIEARPQSHLDRVVRKIRMNGMRLLLAAAMMALLTTVAWLAWTRHTDEAERLRRAYEDHVTGAVMKMYRHELTLNAAAGRFTRIPAELVFNPSDLQSLLGEKHASLAEEVLGELDAATDLLPHRFEAFFYRARALLLMGEEQAALDSLAAALELRPDFLPATVLRNTIAGVDNSETLVGSTKPPSGSWQHWWLLAQRATHAGQWDDAAEYFSHLLELPEPRPYLALSIDALLGRGIARLEAGQLLPAAEDFLKADMKWPGSLEPLLLLGKVYYRMGYPLEADRIFDRLYIRSGSTDETALWIVAVYRSLSDFDRGLEWIGRVDNTFLRERVRAGLLIPLQRFREAVLAAETAASIRPDDSLAHSLHSFNLLMGCIARQGARVVEDKRAAYEAAHRAVMLDEGSAFANSLLALTSVDQGYHDDVLLYGERALALDPDNLYVCFAAGAVHRSYGKFDKAVEHFQRGSQLAREQKLSWEEGHLLHNVALTLTFAGSKDEAAKWFQQAIEIAPRNPSPHRSFGILLRQEGRLEEARSFLEKAVELSPDFHFNHLELAMVYQKLGQSQEALEAARAGFELVDDPSARYFVFHGALLEEELGDVIAATRNYLRAIEIEPRKPRAWERLEDLIARPGYPLHAADVDGLREAIVRAFQSLDCDLPSTVKAWGEAP